MATFLRCGAVDSGEAFTRNGSATFDHFAGYDEFFDSFLRRKGVHRVKQQFFEDHHKAAGSDFPLNSLSGDGFERILGKLQLNIIEIKLLLVLLDQSVLGFCKNLDECSLVEFVEHAAHRQTSNKFRDQSKADQIFRLHLCEGFCVTVHA